MSQIIQLIRGKLVAWPTRGRGKRSFRDRGKLEAWRALIPTAWQIRGVANLGRGKLKAWQTRGIWFWKMRQTSGRGKLRAWQTRGIANLRNLSSKKSGQT